MSRYRGAPTKTNNASREAAAAMVTDIPSRVLRDSRETVRGVAVYLRNKKSQKAIHETGMVGRVHSIERGRERTPERLTIAKIREKPVRVIETINKRHSEMRVDARAIVLIAQIGTLTHAAPVLLARLENHCLYRSGLLRRASGDTGKKNYE